MKFVVTGGNGYIGSHMCKLLYKEGHDVHIIDNHSTSPKYPVHKFGTFHNIDISDQAKVEELLSQHKFDGVFHFAALALVEESQNNPLMYYLENFVKTLKFVDSCYTKGIKKFIFSSTCATFGTPTTDTLSESHPQNPINTYGNTKKLIELMMRDLAEKKMMDFVALRYFNAAGCDPDGDLGENHDPETHLIPNICRSHLSGGAIEFKLYGYDLKTRDGSCIRDYIHVNDLAGAHLAAFNFIDQNRGFHDFNLGTEKGVSVKEVISAFEEVTGEKVKVTLAPHRTGDPLQLVADSTKAKDNLAFNPKFSIQDSIRHTFAYYKNISNSKK